MQKYYKTTELLVSLDSCGTFRGAEHDDKVEFNTAWLHVDQDVNVIPQTGFSVQVHSYGKRFVIGLQGALNLCNGPDPFASGSFQCLDKSHLETKRLFAEGKEKSTGDHYHPFPADHFFYKNTTAQNPALALCVQAGFELRTMVRTLWFWDFS